MIPMPTIATSLSPFFFSLVKLTPMAMAAPPPSLLATLFLSILFLSRAVQTTAAEQKNAFQFIKHMAGSQKGQHVGGLMELKKYLKQFGYLGLDHPQENDVFDDALESAIKAYQLNFHMKATGKMDEDTVKQMIRPRCGVADHVERTRQLPSSKNHLTYKFHYGAQVSLGDKNLKSIFAQAFQRWAEVSHFTFEEVPENSPADIEIEFDSGYHGDDSPFDGAGGVFGHVSRPESGGKSLQFHLDADEKWSANPAQGTAEMDLESVAVHEIGHLLGLDHNTENPESIMYPCLDYGVAKRHLHQDDISRIHAMYGPN